MRLLLLSLILLSAIATEASNLILINHKSLADVEYSREKILPATVATCGPGWYTLEKNVCGSGGCYYFTNLKQVTVVLTSGERLFERLPCEFKSDDPTILSALMRMLAGQAEEKEDCRIDQVCDKDGNCRTRYGTRSNPLQIEALRNGDQIVTWRRTENWGPCK